MRQQNFIICEPMFINFFAFDVKLIVGLVENPRDVCDQNKVVRKRAHCRFWVGQHEPL